MTAIDIFLVLTVSQGWYLEPGSNSRVSVFAQLVGTSLQRCSPSSFSSPPPWPASPPTSSPSSKSRQPQWPRPLSVSSSTTQWATACWTSTARWPLPPRPGFPPTRLQPGWACPLRWSTRRWRTTRGAVCPTWCGSRQRLSLAGKPRRTSCASRCSPAGSRSTCPLRPRSRQGLPSRTAMSWAWFARGWVKMDISGFFSLTISAVTYLSLIATFSIVLICEFSAVHRLFIVWRAHSQPLRANVPPSWTFLWIIRCLLLLSEYCCVNFLFKISPYIILTCLGYFCAFKQPETPRRWEIVSHVQMWKCTNVKMYILLICRYGRMNKQVTIVFLGRHGKANNWVTELMTLHSWWMLMCRHDYREVDMGEDIRSSVNEWRCPRGECWYINMNKEVDMG